MSSVCTTSCTTSGLGHQLQPFSTSQSIKISMAKSASRAVLLPLLLLLRSERKALVSAQESTRLHTNNTVYNWDNPKSIPGPRNPNQPTGGSVCDPASAEPRNYGCVHMSLMSDDMLAAAEHDGNGDKFLYGVAGTHNDLRCGECFQINVLSNGLSSSWVPLADSRQLIIQAVNTGVDVAIDQFDVMMGAGGMGRFQAVNRDCNTANAEGANVFDSFNDALHHCGAGATIEPGMFAGNYNDWTMPRKRGCLDGGITALGVPDSLLTELCAGLSNGETELKDRILFDSCYRTNKHAWHQTFVSYSRVRVQCPEGLYRLTGLRLSEEEDGSIELPVAHPDNHLPHECKGDQGACISTMMDGCVPTCSWPGNLDHPSHDYPRVDRCDFNNKPLR